MPSADALRSAAVKELRLPVSGGGNSLWPDCGPGPARTKNTEGAHGEWGALNHGGYMAKTFGLLALAQRNDRIFKAAVAGTIIYACAVLAVAPTTPAQADGLVLSLRGGAGIGDQLLTGYGERHLSGTLSRLRAVVNRPSYAAYV